MTASSVLKRLKTLGSEQTRKTLKRHGATEPLFGVKIQDLKKVEREIRGDHPLVRELFRTGNSDAMYLACLAADPMQMTPEDLEEWASAAPWSMISDAVAGVAADSPHGWTLGRKWIDSEHENVAVAGWSTLAGVVAVRPDNELDLPAIRRLLNHVGRKIHKAPNRVRYVMNGFVISAGAAVADLTEEALSIANKIGPVEVDMGETACKVPAAAEYIEKIRGMGRIGRKRKTARC
jgi:3-methyladenine DNA glycosylase AlkD